MKKRQILNYFLAAIPTILTVAGIVAWESSQTQRDQYYEARDAHTAQFEGVLDQVAKGNTDLLKVVESIADEGRYMANSDLMSYYRYVALKDAVILKNVPGEKVEIDFSKVDFKKSDDFMMSRLSVLPDLDLAAFLSVFKALISEEGAAEFQKYCAEKQAKQCEPVFVEAGLHSGLTDEQKAQLNACLTKIKWKLESNYQLYLNYDSKGYCAAEARD
jgi:hypothetical protein